MSDAIDALAGSPAIRWRTHYRVCRDSQVGGKTYVNAPLSRSIDRPAIGARVLKRLRRTYPDCYLVEVRTREEVRQ